MSRILEHDSVVPGMERGLGRFLAADREIADGSGRRVPLFCHVLDPGQFWIGFEPGSAAYQVLTNDQNRFSPPRSLPPILDLELPEDPGNSSGGYVITRYAYTEGAYRLVEDLIADGHVFGMNGFLEFAWHLAQALAYLHEHGIVHGQWNARSVVAIPTEERADPLLDVPGLRFEVINTGICYRTPASIPDEYLQRGYYPPEVFLSEQGLPDYGALDLESDVFCLAAFLRDLMQRGCSSEELPSQARRILEQLQKEANRRGSRASPESIRRKEMEVLDHLYTTRVRSETLIQEGLRSRQERCSAARLLELVEDLHDKATSYLRELFDHGFDSVNVFGDELQHYTTFQMEVDPTTVNSHRTTTVILTGNGLPDELVRVTLNESHQGVRVLAAGPGRIEFCVEPGLRSGSYRISVNNRRTNGMLEVVAPVWRALEPGEVHQPWDGFGNIQLRVRGRDLPEDVVYTLRPLGSGSEPSAKHEVPAVVAQWARDGIGEEESVLLTFPCDTEAREYELFVSGLPTGLRTTVLEQLPEPVIGDDGLVPHTVKNHNARTLRLYGRNFDSRMIVDFGDDLDDEIAVSVLGPTEAELRIGARFPAGEHLLRVNFRDTGARLRVIAPAWTGQSTAAIKLLRDQQVATPIELRGTSLPEPKNGAEYGLQGPGGAIAEGVLDVEELEPEKVHRLHLGPAIPRGRFAVRFGELDTGLEVRVRRQWSRAAWAAVLIVGLGLMTGAGAVLHRAFLPTIDAVFPAAVYPHGDPVVTVQGRYLDRVELLDPEGVPIAELPLQDVEESGARGLTPAGLPPGTYHLRPLGPLYGGQVTEHTLTVRSAGFRVEPTEIHRLKDVRLRISAADDFDISSVSSLQLRPVDTSGESAEFAVAGGHAQITRGSFRSGTEGEYSVVLDGHPVTDGSRPLVIRVAGPRLTGITPNPVSLDDQGRIAVTLAGSGLEELPPLWLADPDGEPDDGSPLQRSGNLYRARTAPGRYRLLMRSEGMPAEAIPDLYLDVLPRPVVTGVSPSELKPGARSAVTIVGTNLAALERVLLEPEGEGDLQVEIPIEPGRVLSRQGDEQAFGFDVTLPSGTYRVRPADGLVAVAVYDDCQLALQTYAETGDVEPLLTCLSEGRPPAAVRRRAADLLFDRGLFEPARELYEDGPSPRDRFRAALIDAFVLGRAVTPWPGDEELADDPYTVAAGRLGWSRAGSAEFAGDTALPWELEFVRAFTSDRPETAVEAARSSIARKSRAAGGHEAASFEAAHHLLARSRLGLVEHRLSGIRPLEAAELLAVLVEDGPIRERLDAADRARALFWHGHVQLWYRGDQDAATAAFASGAELAAEPFSTSCADYLQAMEPGRIDLAANDARSWPGIFARVYRLFAEATDSPNYNLLAAAGSTGALLTGEERDKGAVLHGLLERLESMAPTDPFAHHALLYALRNAQRVSWPAQTDAGLAEDHRARLQGLSVSRELEPLRAYYVVRAELEPYDFSQITSFSRSERSEMAGRVESLEPLPLPASFRDSADRLKTRFLNPSVIWWRQTHK